MVARAAAEGLEVRVAGSGHSFTDTACTDGVLIDIGAHGPGGGRGPPPAAW